MRRKPSCVAWGKTGMQQRKKRARIRYAVVGLGHIAQAAVLPAFKHARRNSELTALVSDNARKRDVLCKKYRLRHAASYGEYDDLMRSGEIDAVYIALPNSLHAEYSIRAARAGIHVLCEKPMAVTAKECAAMIKAARKHEIKLMIAYRLHFEEANLKAVEIVKAKKIGEPRFFNSIFSLQVKEGNIRTQSDLGGGTLYDLGVYCINASRNLFHSEPEEVFAYSGARNDHRFKEIDEMTSAVLRFPGERMGIFTSSFGSADVASYDVIGTKGKLRLDPAYEYAMALKLFLTINGKTGARTFPRRDQFAPELLYFSDCIRRNIEPEPSGEEGLADVRIVRALYRAAKIGKPVKLKSMRIGKRPTLKQEKRRPPVAKPQLIRVESASA